MWYAFKVNFWKSAKVLSAKQPASAKLILLTFLSSLHVWTLVLVNTLKLAVLGNTSKTDAYVAVV